MAWRTMSRVKLVRCAVLAGLIYGTAAYATAQTIAGPGANSPAAAGWGAIRSGHNQDAAAVFASAIEADPRNPELYVGAGLAAQLLGDSNKARRFFEEALRLAPDFTTASLLLGDLLYRQSDLPEAIAVYEAAVRYAPGDRTLAARLQRLREEPSAEKGSFQSRSAHFTVLFEGPADDEVAQRAVDVLETAYWRVGTALYTFPEHVITVVLSTQQQFRDTTRSPAWAAAAYDGRIRVPVRGALRQQPGELERVLTHELVHAVVRAIAPRGVPMWLNEGLAVMFESEGLQGAARTLQESPQRIPLDDLAGSFDGLSEAQARTAYAESADAAQRLFDEAGGAGIVALLQDIARGAPFAEAFERRLLTPYSTFASSLGPTN